MLLKQDKELRYFTSMDINLGVVGERKDAGTEEQDQTRLKPHQGAECCLAKQGPGDAGHCGIIYLILTCFSYAVLTPPFLNFQ